MYATKVRHSSSATVSVKTSTQTVWRIRSLNPTVRSTPNALQLPLRRNAARQTQRFVGNECNSGVPKCNDAVSVFEAQRAPWLILCSGLWRAASCAFSPQKLESNRTKIPICQIVLHVEYLDIIILFLLFFHFNEHAILIHCPPKSKWTISHEGKR